MSRYCKNCGAEADDDAYFCQICGHRIPRIRPESALGSPAPVHAPNLSSGGPGTGKYLPAVIAGCVAAFLILVMAASSSRRAGASSRLSRAAASWMPGRRYSSIEPYTAGSYSPPSYTPAHLYENSEYLIGGGMPPGEYVLFSNSSYGGYFCIRPDAAGNDITENDVFSYNAVITVERGEYLELSRCYAEPIDSAGYVSTSGEGQFKIGTHLPAGTYKLQADGSGYDGYYCVYPDSRRGSIDTNGNFENNAYVTVRNGQILKLSRCHIVK